MFYGKSPFLQVYVKEGVKLLHVRRRMMALTV